jgi:hypothetical protein
MNAVTFAQLGEVFAPLPYLLASGGDTRLAVDPLTRLNGYGCRPFPRPDAFTFASSTATSISERAYASADAAREALIRAALRQGLDAAVDDRVDALRGELSDVLDLDRLDTDIVFSPSGTDAELQAVFVARALLGTPITSIIVASDETGSGVPNASCGTHFNSLTAQGAAVEKGGAIAELAAGLTSLSIPLRDEHGQTRSLQEIDAAVESLVAQSMSAGQRVLLHVMDHSKLGARCPSIACVGRIQSRSGDRVQVVIDACQMRLGRGRLRRHLEHGDMILITGSKFFTGPPFSGALLVPAAVSARMGTVRDVPAGLRDYTSRSDWPRAWQGVRASLRERANLGQLLRWVAAVREMRDYFAVPANFRIRALARFAEVVSGLIAGERDLELLPDHERLCADAGGDDQEWAACTIFPFLVRRAGRTLSASECTTIYRALNEDVSGLLPAGATDGERRVAAQLCHIGQPVAMPAPSGGTIAALRISAGARVVSESWSEMGEAAAMLRLEREFSEVRTILEKIALLLTHFDALKHAAPEKKKEAAA